MHVLVESSELPHGPGDTPSGWECVFGRFAASSPPLCPVASQYMSEHLTRQLLQHLPVAALPDGVVCSRALWEHLGLLPCQLKATRMTPGEI